MKTFLIPRDCASVTSVKSTRFCLHNMRLLHSQFVTECVHFCLSIRWSMVSCLSLSITHESHNRDIITPQYGHTIIIRHWPIRGQYYLDWQIRDQLWSVSWEVVTLAPDWLGIVWCVVTDCELLVSNWLYCDGHIDHITSQRRRHLASEELIHCQQVRSVIVCDIVRMMFAVFVTNPGSSPGSQWPLCVQASGH